MLSSSPLKAVVVRVAVSSRLRIEASLAFVQKPTAVGPFPQLTFIRLFWECHLFSLSVNAAE